MGVNKYENHVYVIPEDDADRQLAGGFVRHPLIRHRRIQVMSPAGGWLNVVDVFKREYLKPMRGNPRTHVVLLMDFDRRSDDRRNLVGKEIPEDVRDRVFLLGVIDEPEDLKRALDRQSLEAIGEALADECARDVDVIRSHEQIRLNEPELARLAKEVKPFLFTDAGAGRA